MPHGDSVSFQIPEEISARLIEVAREHEATAFMVLQAAVAVVLSKMGAGSDIPVGFSIAGPLIRDGRPGGVLREHPGAAAPMSPVIRRSRNCCPGGGNIAGRL